MTENKRFQYNVNKNCIEYDDNFVAYVNSVDGFRIANKLNCLEKENEQLKKELKVYRKVANCGNCHYHSYDWFDDGDEFEVCDKGNDVTDGICEDWEEL